VLSGKLEVKAGGKTHVLAPNGYAYLPQGTPHTVRALTASRAAVIEKAYEAQPGAAAPDIVVGNENNVADVALMGDKALRVRSMMPMDRHTTSPSIR